MGLGFERDTLSPADLDRLRSLRTQCAADIVRLVSLAACGHPGGSLSTLDALLVLYTCGALDPAAPHDDHRDRVVISHGHISPGVYATLGNLGYFDMRECYRGFRRAGSVFGGHVESVVPGVEWNTGNLGQGLSAGVGFALAARVRGKSHNVFVGMGDGEQQKGQVGEARRFAAKFKFSHLIAFVDVNGLQIGGKTSDIMPMDIAGGWIADGWNVIEVDGHDLAELYRAFRAAVRRQTANPDAPTVLLLRTVMGKGISFIEHDHNYHGQALSDEMTVRAFAELGVEDNLAALRADRAAHTDSLHHRIVVDRDIRVDVGEPITYRESTDCRTAYGAFLADMARRNHQKPGHWPIVGVSADLEGSVKMGGFRKGAPDWFFEGGIAEHNHAVVVGAASKDRVVPFFSTFGMFAVAEGYNQQRLNDQNGAAPKIVVTHCGLDVGEDGPTHQSIDYVGLIRNLFGFELYVPADPNETDRILRAVTPRYAPTVVAMGRSKLPILTNASGDPLYGGDARFEPGVWTTVREGSDAVVFAYGPMVYRAVEAHEALARQGVSLRVVNASSLKPIDERAILDAARTIGRIVVYEDQAHDSGLGLVVAATLGEHGVAAQLRRMAVRRYGSSGKPDALYAEQGLAPSDLVTSVLRLVGR
jgi:transketolase